MAEPLCVFNLPGHVPPSLPVNAAYQPFFLFSQVLALRLQKKPCAKRSGLNVGVFREKGCFPSPA